MKIKIEDIKIVDNYYPRASFNNELVNKYLSNVEALPPIILTRELVLVDGKHRIMAHQLAGLNEIDVEEPLLNLTGEQIYIEAIKRNAFHGSQLTQAEKRKAARRLYEDSHQDTKELQSLLGAGRSTIDEWLKDLKAQKREERNQLILELYLKCCTEEEIAEKLGVAQKTVSNVINDSKNSISGKITMPESLQLTNVWNFPQCDDRYGLDFPGRIPGQIVENLLYYYTEPFDLVVDPMAGGGTSIDVCKAMYRRYRAYDIKPVREDIKTHDIQSGFPTEVKGVSLIILDPPYWRLNDSKYSRESISASSLQDWLVFMGNLAKNCKKVLKDRGHVALIIEAFLDEKVTGDFLDLAYECLGLFQKAGFKERQRISIPMPSQVKSHHDVKYAKENKILLDLNRDLLILEKV